MCASPERTDHCAHLNALKTVLRIGESELELLEQSGPGPGQEFIDRWGEGLFAAGYASARFDALTEHLQELGQFCALSGLRSRSQRAVQSGLNQPVR